jgi:predicted nucleotidyltransferase component of viral defense system
MKSNLQLELEVEAYNLYFQDKIKTSEALLSFAGIICHLEGDIALYRMKHGLNEKIQEVIDRNEKLKQIYDHFYILSEQIEQMKMIVRKNNARMLQMDEENEKLTKLLTNYKSWE